MNGIQNVRPINKSLCLEQLCEKNYRKLLTLIPDIYQYKRHAFGYCNRSPDLHLRIIDRAPYTMTVELSHYFNRKLSAFLEPAVVMRLYSDARLAEVLSDHERIQVNKAISDPGQAKEIMDYKWSMNYFLDKWLDHCLSTDYQFFSEAEMAEPYSLKLKA